MDEPQYGHLSIEVYADVLAHVRHFGRREQSEVLRRLGVSEVDWELAVRGWTEALSEEAAQELEVLSRRFAGAFAVARARLKKEAPSIPSLVPLPGRTAAPEEESAPPIEQVLPEPQPAQALPPWPATTSKPVAPPPPLPNVPPMIPRGMRHFMSLGATTGPITDGVIRTPLPFTAAPAEKAMENAVAHAEATQGPEIAARGLDGATADISGAVPKGHAVPFSGVPATAPPILNETSELPAAARNRPVIPFRDGVTAEDRKPIDDVPAISLEQYASLCVELQLHPERKQEVLHRYRLIDEQWGKLNAAWTRRLSSDPELRNNWNQAQDVYRAWLLKGRTGG